MAVWVFCNRCFQPPGKSSSQFSLTSCGHVFCHLCLQQGKKEECLICGTPCRIILLSKQTDFNIQAFFMGIDGLCKKYSKETSQISEFQEKHRRRLLAFYREKISKLEESLKTLTQQIQQIQRVESMDIDLSPSPMRKLETAAGPARLSLISPPQDGRMGSVSYRGPPQVGLTSSQNSMSRIYSSWRKHTGKMIVVFVMIQTIMEGIVETSVACTAFYQQGLLIPSFHLPSLSFGSLTLPTSPTLAIYLH
ncbi:probable E3 SUMO-protein ligase RNF212 [Vombatus ursinus]|uniref:probable E3 SUMO-protein ligase RNF212 n=1 Tax=Vombatus ursinus TaxID=29139 RepID=UPI000FFD2A70|nr:probable E3 SUMO-protein ligase RNF212 [Vombatus ursinus]